MILYQPISAKETHAGELERMRVVWPSKQGPVFLLYLLSVLVTAVQCSGEHQVLSKSYRGKTINLLFIYLFISIGK